MLRNLALQEGKDLEYIAYIIEENAKAKIKAEKRKQTEATKKAPKNVDVLESLPIAKGIALDNDDEEDGEFFKTLGKHKVKK